MGKKEDGHKSATGRKKGKRSKREKTSVLTTAEQRKAEKKRLKKAERKAAMKQGVAEFDETVIDTLFDESQANERRKQLEDEASARMVISATARMKAKSKSKPSDTSALSADGWVESERKIKVARRSRVEDDSVADAADTVMRGSRSMVEIALRRKRKLAESKATDAIIAKAKKQSDEVETKDSGHSMSSETEGGSGPPQKRKRKSKRAREREQKRQQKEAQRMDYEKELVQMDTASNLLTVHSAAALAKKRKGKLKHVRSLIPKEAADAIGDNGNETTGILKTDSVKHAMDDEMDVKQKSDESAKIDTGAIDKYDAYEWGAEVGSEQKEDGSKKKKAVDSSKAKDLRMKRAQSFRIQRERVTQLKVCCLPHSWYNSKTEAEIAYLLFSGQLKKDIAEAVAQKAFTEGDAKSRNSVLRALLRTCGVWDLCVFHNVLRTTESGFVKRGGKRKTDDYCIVSFDSVQHCADALRHLQTEGLFALTSKCADDYSVKRILVVPWTDRSGANAQMHVWSLIGGFGGIKHRLEDLKWNNQSAAERKDHSDSDGVVVELCNLHCDTKPEEIERLVTGHFAKSKVKADGNQMEIEFVIDRNGYTTGRCLLQLDSMQSANEFVRFVTGKQRRDSGRRLLDAAVTDFTDVSEAMVATATGTRANNGGVMRLSAALSAEKDKQRRVALFNLSPDCVDSDVFELLCSVVSRESRDWIENVHLIRHCQRRLPAYAFVTLKDAAEVPKVVAKLSGRTLDGRLLKAVLSETRAQRTVRSELKGRTDELTLSNVRSDASERDLVEFVKRHCASASPKRVQMCTNAKGYLIGMARVLVASCSEAKYVQQSCDGQLCGGRQVHVNFWNKANGQREERKPAAESSFESPKKSARKSLTKSKKQATGALQSAAAKFKASLGL